MRIKILLKHDLKYLNYKHETSDNVSYFAGSYVELKRKTDLEYWRQFVFYSVFIIAYFISSLILIASLLYAIKVHDFSSLGIFLCLLIIAGYLLFNRKISYKIKSYIIPLFFFIIFASTMYFFGPTSESRLWAFLYIFVSSIFSTLLYSVIATIVVIVTDALFGFFQSHALLHWVEVIYQPLESWYNVSFNFLVLMLIMLLITRYLFLGIQEALNRTNK